MSGFEVIKRAGVSEASPLPAAGSEKGPVSRGLKNLLDQQFFKVQVQRLMLGGILVGQEALILSPKRK